MTTDFKNLTEMAKKNVKVPKTMKKSLYTRIEQLELTFQSTH